MPNNIYTGYYIKLLVWKSDRGENVLMNVISKILQNRKDKKISKELQEKKERQKYVDSTVQFAQLLADEYSRRQALEIINMLHNKDLFVAYMLCAGE